LLAIQRPGGPILRLNTTRGDSAQMPGVSAFSHQDQTYLSRLLAP